MALAISSAVVQAEIYTLREAAEGTGTYVGAALNYWSLQSDAKYRNMAIKQYNILVAECVCKMPQIAKDWNKFDWKMCKYMHDFAKDHGMKFRGHTLIWAKDGSWIPKFIRWNNEKWKIEDFMKRYIQQTVSQFKGVYAWDVVNEAISEKGNEVLRSDNVFSKVDDFVCKAFKWARAADPTALLFINDYSVLSATGWSKKKSDKMYNLVKDLKARGCPIDGVGLQSHVDLGFGQSSNRDMPNFDGVRQNMQRYKALGLMVQLTEVTVECNPRNCPWNWSKNDLQIQSDIFSKLLMICLQESNCDAFLTWGMTDKHSFYKAPKNVLPWKSNYEAKVAVWDMIGQLKWYRQNVIGNLMAIPTEQEALSYSDASDNQEGFVQI